MSVVIPPGFGEATLSFGNTGVPRQARVIIGFEDANLLTPDEIAEDIRDATWGALGPSMEDSVTLASTRVVINRAGLLLAGSASATAAGTGGAFAVMPPQVSVKVYKRTAQVGRSQRGAAFLPPWNLSETDVLEDGRMSTSRQAILQSDVNDWKAALDTAQLSMFLLHDETAPDTTPTVVTSLTVDRLTHTQRRRIRPLS